MRLGSSSAFAGFKAKARAKTFGAKTFRARTFVLPVALGIGALLAFQADAQQSPPPSANPPAAPEGPVPPPGPDAQPQAPRWRDGARGGWNRGGRQDGPQAAISAQDRDAYFSARIAAVKAGLLLTPEQEKLWPPAEAAVRDMVRQRAEAREQFRKEGRPSNPIDAMRKMGEAQAARGEAMKKMADAVGPLYASLNDDQKRRLRFLTRGFGRMAMGMGMGAGMGPGMRMGMAGPRGFDHHMGPDGERREWGRNWGGDRDRDMHRGPDSDGQRGYGQRWREGMNDRGMNDRGMNDRGTNDRGMSGRGMGGRGMNDDGASRDSDRSRRFDRNESDRGFDRGKGGED